MPETLVIALGGNAITRPGEPGTIPQQFEHTAETLGHLMPVFRSDARIVVTHGNGPQIGNILIRVEEAERRVPRLPLDTCVSDSQGGMGYMIQRIAFELFRREHIDRTAVTVITQVLVSEGDPDMVHPTKPIGRFYSTSEMEDVRRERPHWELGEIAPGRWRRVVASPRPLRIMEEDAIACLVQAGVVVIACGGGGIPVAWEDDRLVGVEGVVDKERASSLLARDLHAQKLIIVTSKVHTRRAAALWRILASKDGQAIVRGVSDEGFRIDHWWGNTSDALDVVREVLGLFNAWAGLPLQPAQN